MEGKKIPWAFKEYGVCAEKDIYQTPGCYIGSKKYDGRFYRLEDPTKEELMELKHYWTDEKVRKLPRRVFELTAEDILCNQR